MENNIDSRNLHSQKSNYKSNKTVFYTVFGVATLLVALVGATFAYFTTSINSQANHSVNVTTKDLAELSYSGSTIEMREIIPGTRAIENNTFTISNPSVYKTVQSYDLDLVIDTNEFTNIEGEKQLILQVVGEVTTAGASKNSSDTPEGAESIQPINGGNTWDLTDGVRYIVEGEGDNITERVDENHDGNSKAGTKLKIVDNQKIGVGGVHTYTVNLSFEELGTVQDTNKDREFVAHIELSDDILLTQ